MKDLRKLRTSKKLTVSELSQAARIEQVKIRSYEFGYEEISPEHLERLNMVLTVDLKFYFGRHFGR